MLAPDRSLTAVLPYSLWAAITAVTRKKRNGYKHRNAGRNRVKPREKWPFCRSGGWLPVPCHGGGCGFEPRRPRFLQTTPVARLALTRPRAAVTDHSRRPGVQASRAANCPCPAPAKTTAVERHQPRPTARHATQPRPRRPRLRRRTRLIRRGNMRCPLSAGRGNNSRF
jgi:hypothetical protein